MSTIERLQAMEALWDSFMEEESEIDSRNGIGTSLKRERERSKNGKDKNLFLLKS